jgi:hypothetical protein
VQRTSGAIEAFVHFDFCSSQKIASSGRKEATCAQELISGNERLSRKSMLFNRRHSAASFSLVLSGIAKVEAPVCWFESTAILADDNGRHILAPPD